MHWRRGGSIEDVGDFLCRGGTQDRVRKKAEEMGWWPNVCGRPELPGDVCSLWASTPKKKKKQKKKK